MINEALSAAIIGGGKSKRFGEPKALADFRGKPLIRHAVELARRIAPRVFLINGQTVAFEEIGIPVISDLIPDLGPIGGLFTALTKSPTPYMAVLPVDTPLLNEEVYRLLFRQMEPDRPVVAMSHKGLEPLISIWPITVLPRLKDQIERMDYSLRSILRQEEAVVVNFSEKMHPYNPDVFLNINYKKDLLSYNP